MTVVAAAAGHDEIPGKCNGYARQRGGLCTQAAGWGTDHPGIGRCKLHGGNTPTHRAAALQEQAKREALALGEPVPIDGVTALQDALARANGMVQYWSARVALLTSGDAGAEALKQLDVTGRFQKPSVELEQLNQAVQRYAEVAAKCVGLGIAATAVSVVQEHGQQLVAYTRLLLERLDLDPEDARVVEVVRESLQLVGGGST